jgi:DNA-binding MarR family transcriptional regulator
VLVVVEQSKEKLTQQNLSDYFKTSKVSMVRIIDYLAKKGYLRRKVNAKDRREHFLVLTEKSKRELPLIKDTLREVEASALQGFSEEEKQQFFQFLEQIYINLSKLPAEDIFVNYEKVKERPKKLKKLSVADTAEH